MLVSLCSRRDNVPRKGSSEELQGCWGSQAARGDAFPCPATMSCLAVPPASPWLFVLFGRGVLVPSARGAAQLSFSEGVFIAARSGLCSLTKDLQLQQGAS